MAEEPREEQEAVPAGGDAAKASAALNALDRNDDDVENKSADTEALGKAMANLDVKEEKKADAPKKVKIDAEDVKLLVGFACV
jgi:hypothetical protein